MLGSVFAVVFGLFLLALAVLCGFIVTWAVRRDRTRWREWQDRNRD